MRYRYTEWDGTEYPTQEHLGLFQNIMNFVLQHGQEALDALEQVEDDEEYQKMLQQLIEDGLLEKTGATWRLTPRAINAMQRKALMEIFKNLRKGIRDGHDAMETGRDGERAEGTAKYQFGDPVSELEPSAILRNALRREGSGLPIRIREEDFELYQSEGRTSCSLVILLDMSGSMMRYNRFYQAKKCAMALHALIRQRFPLDTVDLVGFYSTAERIHENKLPLLMPKPVSIFDYEVRMRLPLSKAHEGPQHFTNLHMGLTMARQILRRRGGDNKQIFIITDGQPTAHVQGDILYLLYPPDRATSLITLKEAVRATQEGIRLSTFALIEDYFYMDWVGFVDQLTKLTKGVAFYCASGDLSSCVMESYLSGRKSKSYIA
jgi:uncharacterized protein with von Willebrand factor type A (vWA) domain